MRWPSLRTFAHQTRFQSRYCLLQCNFESNAILRRSSKSQLYQPERLGQPRNLSEIDRTPRPSTHFKRFFLFDLQCNQSLCQEGRSFRRVWYWADCFFQSQHRQEPQQIHLILLVSQGLLGLGYFREIEYHRCCSTRQSVYFSQYCCRHL